MILGDQLGLPSLWVMFSIIVGGGMFGILGMFLGVPVFAVLYVVVRGFVSGPAKERISGLTICYKRAICSFFILCLNRWPIELAYRGKGSDFWVLQSGRKLRKPILP